MEIKNVEPLGMKSINGAWHGKNPSRHKRTMYWAERAVSPMHGFVPMKIVDYRDKDGTTYRVGTVSGFAVCVGNFEAVEKMRRERYNSESLANAFELN